MRTRRSIVAGLGVMALVGATLFVTASPAAPAGPPIVGYTVIASDGCTLATIDLSTGDVTALGAGFTGLACVDDLAVAPDGTVYGITNFFNGLLIAHLVRFDADGTPVDLGPFTGDFTESELDEGGIAFGPGNQLFVHMQTDEGIGECDGNNDDACLYGVDVDTLVATLIGPPNDGQSDSFHWLAAPCSGSMLSVTEGEPIGPVSTAEPDAETEATVAGDDQAAQGDVGALLVPTDLWTINPTTGLFTAGPPITPTDPDTDEIDVVGIDHDRASGAVYLLGAPLEFVVGPDGVGAQSSFSDVISIFQLDPATGAATELVAVSDSELILGALALPGSCVQTFPLFTG